MGCLLARLHAIWCSMKGYSATGWVQVGASINIALVKAELLDVAVQLTAWMMRKGYVTDVALTSHEIIQMDEVPVAAAIITGMRPLTGYQWPLSDAPDMSGYSAYALLFLLRFPGSC